jgi:ABC-type transporter Mla MlaB component
MLMITCIEESDPTRTLKLEGKLQGPWVAELQIACEEAQSPPSCVRLDLAAVSFVDTAGVDCLQELIREGVPIVACSGFVAELLKLDGQ